MERKNYCLGKIEDASTHLLGVINDVLDMSKIEANKFELSLAEFNFERTLRKAVNVINFRVEEKKQSFTVHVGKHIPSRLVGDDQRLTQVITNLLSNAVKFTPEGGAIRLDSHLLEEEEGVCTIQIGVSDTGIGISKEQQDRLFNSFVQAESTTSRKFGGTGLGLAISKRIVEKMDGRIWVESEPGKGSRFIFTIKARRGSEEIRGNDLAAAAENQKDEIEFAGKHILLAEDIDINREIVLALLEPAKLEIDCAENGLQAVEKFEADPGRYDMIFMDVQMPEMDGYEATRKIRALEIPRAKTIPIIAMTANVFREDVENCLAAGMNGHVGKPLDYDEVLDWLRKYLGN
jgi:CheY-like chemotaxis protein